MRALTACTQCYVPWSSKRKRTEGVHGEGNSNDLNASRDQKIL